MPALIGIAKLAAEGAELEAKRQVTYTQLPTRKYVAKVPSTRVPFNWTINPYRGCEYGCKYCYARYTHEFMELRNPEQFERRIFAKEFDPARFRKEIQRMPVGESLAIGTATDPYQPAERRFKITQQMLQILAETGGLRLGITTKSDLIARDAGLLRLVARRHYVTVFVTITTLDTELARLLEPMAPRPDLRLAAVRTLASAGVRVGVGCSPVLPLINDDEESLERLASLIAEAGAFQMHANVLFLKPSASQVFLPFLQEKFPHLVRRYRERFDRHAYLSGAYPQMIHERMARIRSRHFPLPEGRPEPELWPQDPQMDLFEVPS